MRPSQGDGERYSVSAVRSKREGAVLYCEEHRWKHKKLHFSARKDAYSVCVLTDLCLAHRNHPNAVSLSKKLGTQADFVAVSLIDNQTLLETYVAEHRCPFSVLFGVTPTLKKDLRMGITPQLLVLSSTGELLKVWSGTFVDKNREEVEAFLHVKI